MAAPNDLPVCGARRWLRQRHRIPLGTPAQQRSEQLRVRRRIGVGGASDGRGIRCDRFSGRFGVRVGEVAPIRSRCRGSRLTARHAWDNPLRKRSDFRPTFPRSIHLTAHGPNRCLWDGCAAARSFVKTPLGHCRRIDIEVNARDALERIFASVIVQHRYSWNGPVNSSEVLSLTRHSRGYDR